MSRTVIRLEEWGDQNGEVHVNFRPEEPADVPERLRWRTLDSIHALPPFIDLAAVTPGQAIPNGNSLTKTVGQEIHKALSLHPGVAQALDRAANVAPGGVHPIHLLTSALDAEAVPWEALHHPLGNFLGLDPRFAIARAVNSGSGELERVLDAPLRIVAILAAADRDARGEWAALRGAINSAGLECHVTLFVAQDDLENEVNATHDAWVELRRVPPTKDELVAALQGLRPHILHVYSHGSALGGGFLEIATPGSVNGFGDPPLYLEARHLAALQDSVWLMTFNACEGASPAGGVHSLAYSLVESGAPAAIGMREVIDSLDANIFCQSFYTSAFADLAQKLLPGTQVPVDWARYLATAREALCAGIAGPASATAGQQKPWTLPVLYRRTEELVIRTPGDIPGVDQEARAHALGELEVFRHALANLHPDNPPVVRVQLEASIAALEAQILGP